MFTGPSSSTVPSVVKEEPASDGDNVDWEEAARSLDEDAVPPMVPQTLEEDEEQLVAGICASLLDVPTQMSPSPLQNHNVQIDRNSYLELHIYGLYLCCINVW